jgi:hypothetical protein
MGAIWSSPAATVLQTSNPRFLPNAFIDCRIGMRAMQKNLYGFFKANKPLHLEVGEACLKQA